MSDPTAARLSVINEALLGLKANRIESFEDEVEGVDDIERKYLTIVGTLLTHPSFATSVQRVALARQDAATGYAYNYTSPIGGDILAIYDSATTQRAHADFRIVNGKVNTDLTEAWAEVLVGSEPDSWAPYVRDMVVKCLEAEFAYDITGDAALARLKRQIAYGPPGEDPDGGVVRTARNRAGQQQGGGVLRFGESELTSARYR